MFAVMSYFIFYLFLFVFLVYLIDLFYKMIIVAAKVHKKLR